MDNQNQPLQSIPSDPAPINRDNNAQGFYRKTNWKFIAIVVVFALLTVGGILLLKGTQTLPPAPSPQPQAIDTSGWQTYRNEEFGFEVKYPERWHVAKGNIKTKSPEVVFELLFKREPFPTPEECDFCWEGDAFWDGNPHPWPEMEMLILEKPFTNEELQRTGVRDYEGNIPIEGDIGQFQYEQTTFIGLRANKKISISPSDIGDLSYINVSFNFGNYGWFMSYPTTDYSGGHDLIYDQILSTFRFVKPIGK